MALVQGYQGTASSGYFAESAQELARRLDGDLSPAARELAEHARELAALFREWATRRPSDDERVSTIRELFDLNRRVLGHAAEVRTGVRATVPSSPDVVIKRK